MQGATMIKYNLIKSKLLTADKSPFVPKTIQEGNVSLEQAMKEIAYGSSITVADVKAVFENIERICIDNLSQGRSINLGFCSLRPQVKGNFKEEKEVFSKKKHWIEISLAPNIALGKKVTKDAKVVRVNRDKPQPIMLSIENHSNEKNTIEIGDLISLTGERLAFEKTDLDLGLFFLKKDTEIRVTEYSLVMNKKISFKVPKEVSKGNTYKLILKTRMGTKIKLTKLTDNLKIY